MRLARPARVVDEWLRIVPPPDDLSRRAVREQPRHEGIGTACQQTTPSMCSLRALNELITSGLLRRSGGTVEIASPTVTLGHAEPGVFLDDSRGRVSRLRRGTEPAAGDHGPRARRQREQLRITARWFPVGPSITPKSAVPLGSRPLHPASASCEGRAPVTARALPHRVQTAALGGRRPARAQASSLQHQNVGCCLSAFSLDLAMDRQSHGRRLFRRAAEVANPSGAIPRSAMLCSWKTTTSR